MNKKVVIVLTIVLVGLLTGCVATTKIEFKDLVEPTDDCYKVHEVSEFYKIHGTDWSKMYVEVVNTCLGLQKTYICRYNRVTQEIIWEPELTNTSWVREKSE